MTSTSLNDPATGARTTWGVHVAAWVLAAACFLSQSFLLPVFVYSFPLLIAVTAWCARGKLTQPIGSRRAIALGLPLMVVIFHSVNPAAVVFLVTSLACAFLMLRLDAAAPDLKGLAASRFVEITLILGIVGTALLVAQPGIEGLYQQDPAQNTMRFRGLNMEPSHLGFALCAIYILTLYDPAQRSRRQRHRRMFMVGGIWLASLLTMSPFALAMMSMISFFYLMRTPSGGMLCAVCLIALAALASQSQRIQDILTGEDSSGNFRTWGSLVIGYTQIENCGFIGCGLGNSKNVLADEPLMSAFGAQETLALPNMLAGAMVEGGWVFLGFVILAIGFAAFPRHGEALSPALSVTIFLFLLLYSASASYPYDAQFWSTTGLLAALARTQKNRLT